MTRSNLLRWTSAGLYCEPGGFHIDPVQPVRRAVITHAHGDHLCRGHREYLTSLSGVPLVRARLGPSPSVFGLPYGETLSLADIKLSLHPAGHILGSAQVRLEHQGRVWCVTGDYKRHPDPTCEPFETQRCQTLVTEATFARPEFIWPDPSEVMGSIDRWWQTNQAEGLASILRVYALGKAQRILATLPNPRGPIEVHASIDRWNQVYRHCGIQLPVTSVGTRSSAIPSMSAAGRSKSTAKKRDGGGPAPLVLLPPAADSPLSSGFWNGYREARVSGWGLQSPAPEKPPVQAIHTFPISDHVDWPSLLQTIRESEAEEVFLMHGDSRYLLENPPFPGVCIRTFIPPEPPTEEKRIPCR